MMFKFISFLSLLSCVIICDGERPKFIIDNDAGGDDAVAIFLSLLYEKYFDGPELVALTTGNGNTDEDNVYRNNQRLLKIAGRQDIPIYRGSTKSLIVTPEVGHYYGLDGLGDADNEAIDTDLVKAKDENAVEALLKLSKQYKDDLTIITIGTLTNVAKVVLLDPDFINRVNHIYVGAGHIESRKHATVEFNAHMDVEAYHIVMQAATPDKVTILPFSQTQEYLNFTKTWREDVFGAINTDIMRAMNKYEAVALKRSDWWTALDPATVTTFINPDIVNEYMYSKHGIIVCGHQRGINTNTFVENEDSISNARIVFSLKDEEYKKFLMDVFTAELNKDIKH